MFNHGFRQTKIQRTADGKPLIKTLVWCAVHEMQVDIVQWEREHRNCLKKGKDLIAGNALELPKKDGKPKFLARAAAA